MAPPHLHRVHAYAGGLGEFWSWPHESVSEVINDINLDLTNFWDTLKDPVAFGEFQRQISVTPFSQVEWERAQELLGEHGAPCSLVQRAVAFFVLCRQSMSGRMTNFAPLSRTRTRRGMNEQASAWIGAIEGLPQVHERLRPVAILHNHAPHVIRSQDGLDTLHYIDAPYIHSTRSTTKEYGEHEMTDEQHRELIDTLLSCKGKVMVSMYHHPIYDALHLNHGWRVVEFDLPNNAASGDVKRRMTECVWCSFAA